MQNSIGLYVHIPFCKSKCPYCDFYSVRTVEENYEKYFYELTKKIYEWSKKVYNPVATVYFGGGTPSVLGAKRLCSLLESVKSNFNVLPDAEITVEINPDTGKTIDFSALRNVGFNRISIGMQTAVENELKVLGRIHSADDARKAVKRAKDIGFENISLDLMMGIPDQTIESLEKSIDFCAECGVTHVSSYILKIEKNTPFFKMQDSLKLADDDLQAEMYLHAVEMLDRLGYKQYEISNFAVEGFESLHNINYWQCGEYIGIGPSAHSYFDGKRFYYGRSMTDFFNNKTVFDCMGGSEEEYIMLALRLKSGFNFEEYRTRYDKKISESFIRKAVKFKNAGFAELDDKHFALTPKGFLVSNAIISELI